MVRAAVWSTGQDQCAVIKRQLQLLLPTAVIFLDVDDLEDIGDLEGYVAKTSAVLIFLSGGYFSSVVRPSHCAETFSVDTPLALKSMILDALRHLVSWHTSRRRVYLTDAPLVLIGRIAYARWQQLSRRGSTSFSPTRPTSPREARRSLCSGASATRSTATTSSTVVALPGGTPTPPPSPSPLKVQDATCETWRRSAPV